MNNSFSYSVATGGMCCPHGVSVDPYKTNSHIKLTVTSYSDHSKIILVSIKGHAARNFPLTYACQTELGGMDGENLWTRQVQTLKEPSQLFIKQGPN